MTILLIISTVFACSPREKKTFSEAVWSDQVQATKAADLYAPHCQDRTFFSPWMKMPDKNFLDVIGWKLSPNDTYTGEEKDFLPQVLPDTAARIQQTKGDFILWIGHNTFLIRIKNNYWITDPIFSKRALLPARLTPPALSLEAFNKIVIKPNILISHNHYDHLDRKTIQALPESSNVYVPLGLKDYVSEMNKPRVKEMDWWQEITIDKDSKLVCLPAQHWSLRINQGRNRSLWASWLLITPKVTLYFGGDSGYFKGFKEIGRKYPGIDYAFLPTTAYHPRWFMHYQHMSIQESIRAFDDLGAKFFIPTQWGTFHLGSEPAGFPGLDLERHIRQKNLDASRFKIFNIGHILAI